MFDLKIAPTDAQGAVFKTYKVHFETAEDLRAFAELAGQRVTRATREIWWPKRAAA